MYVLMHLPSRKFFRGWKKRSVGGGPPGWWTGEPMIFEHYPARELELLGEGWTVWTRV